MYFSLFSFTSWKWKLLSILPALQEKIAWGLGGLHQSVLSLPEWSEAANVIDENVLSTEQYSLAGMVTVPKWQHLCFSVLLCGRRTGEGGGKLISSFPHPSVSQTWVCQQICSKILRVLGPCFQTMNTLEMAFLWGGKGKEAVSIIKVNGWLSLSKTFSSSFLLLNNKGSVNTGLKDSPRHQKLN